MRLGAEGFLELYPRRGAMVKEITTEELFDLYDVRLLVETHAARRICRDRRPLPETLDELCALHDEIEEGDHIAFADLNSRFHETIIAASGNAVLLQVFQNLRANLTRVAMLSFRLGLPKLREGAMHRAIVKALKAHDEARAVELTEEHLRRMPRLVASLPRAGLRRDWR
jgi:DNA-binding GntR family transcriptional regulator